MGYYSSGDGNPFLSGKSMREQVSDLIREGDGDCRVALLFLTDALDVYMGGHEAAHAAKHEPDPRQYVLWTTRDGCER